MYTLVLVVITTVFVIGPSVDGHPTRNLALPPTVTQTFTQAGTYPTFTACRDVAAFLHNRQTAYADIETSADCLVLGQAPSGQAALDR